MPAIHEIATLTSKGQVTVPKSVRQLLGLDTGGKIAFDVRAGEVVVSRVESIHEDPAIGAFLGLLEADIRSGRNLPPPAGRPGANHARQCGPRCKSGRRYRQ